MQLNVFRSTTQRSRPWWLTASLLVVPVHATALLVMAASTSGSIASTASPSTVASSRTQSESKTAAPPTSIPSEQAPSTPWWPSWLAVNWLASPRSDAAPQHRSGHRAQGQGGADKNTTWSTNTTWPAPATSGQSAMSTISSTSTADGHVASPTSTTADASTTTDESSPPVPTETSNRVPRFRFLPPDSITDPESNPTPPGDGNSSGEEPQPRFGLFLSPIRIDPDPIPRSDTVHVPALATAMPSFLGVAIVPPQATATEASEPESGQPQPVVPPTPPVQVVPPGQSNPAMPSASPPDPPMPSVAQSDPPMPSLAQSNPPMPAASGVDPTASTNRSPSSSPNAQPSVPRPSMTSSTCGNNHCDATETCASCPQDCSFARPVLLPKRHLSAYRRAVEPLRLAAAAGSQSASETLQRVQRLVQGTESKVIACDAPHAWQVCQRPNSQGQQQAAAVVVMGDVHPHPIWTVKTVDALSEAGVTATIFLNPYRMMGRGVGPQGDLLGVKRAVKHAVSKGHSLGLLVTEAPFSVATLAMLHDVYSRLPTWLDLPDSDVNLGVLDVPHAPASLMYPSWAPKGLHIASPMYLTYPSLPLSTTRALFAVNATLVIPTFPVHESMLSHLLIPDLAAAMDVVEYHLSQLKGHAGVPGWIVSIEAGGSQDVKLIEPIVKVLRERVGVRFLEGGINECDKDRVGPTVGRARDVVDKLRGEARREPVVSMKEDSVWVVGLEDGHADRDEFLFSP